MPFQCSPDRRFQYQLHLGWQKHLPSLFSLRYFNLDSIRIRGCSMGGDSVRRYRNDERKEVIPVSKVVLAIYNHPLVLALPFLSNHLPSLPPPHDRLLTFTTPYVC